MLAAQLLSKPNAKEPPMTRHSPFLKSHSSDDSVYSAGILEKALDQTVAAKIKIEQSALELVVNNAVLKHEMPAQVQNGEIAAALKKNDKLEVNLNEAVQQLEEVNQALTAEIDQREVLERELAEARSRLSEGAPS